MRAIKVLSLFDGISCARVALERANIKIDAYYVSEVDKYCLAVVRHNDELKRAKDTFYKMTTQLGDVRYIKSSEAPRKVDLLIGGSPCQDLSISKKNRKGLDGERSGLFWDYVRIKKQVRPKWFVLENVASMSKESKAIISEALGVEPIMINTSLVSAQNRKRLFWTNILNVVLPEDKGILLKDILENGITDREKSHCLDANYFKGTSLENYIKKSRRQIIFCDCDLQVLKEGRTEEGKKSRKEIREKTGRDSTLRNKIHKAYFGRPALKANCLTTRLGAEGMIIEKQNIRKLTPIECERLQGLPDNYTAGVSNSQRYKMLGNAFNVDVVAHILSFI
jgi:DNA-cytosine methyltransferase